MRKFFIGLSLISTAACAGSPAAPSVPQSGMLDGSWHGTLTITRAGQQPVIGPTVWQFVGADNTSHLLYRTTMTNQNAWFAANVLATTTLVPPGTSPSDVQTTGVYDSPRGCQGSFYSYGLATAGSFSASFHGVDCNSQTFDGTVSLSR